MTAERQAEFLAGHGKNFNKFKENPQFFDYYEKVYNNPLYSSSQSKYIKNIDYLSLVETTYKSSNHGELLIQHLRVSFKKIIHNNQEYNYGYTGFHFDNITEPSHITPTTSIINGRPYMTGPPPTVNAPIQTAIKAGTEVLGNGVKECEVLIWGYAARRTGGVWRLELDASGNPIKCWIKKINNQGKTTIFMGWSEEKTLNEIAFARFNLQTTDWEMKIGQFSNEWTGKSSDGKDIGMYIGFGVQNTPVGVPPQNTNYGSAFPKK